MKWLSVFSSCGRRIRRNQGLVQSAIAGFFRDEHRQSANPVPLFSSILDNCNMLASPSRGELQGSVAAASVASDKKAGSWSFPSYFWTANLVELCERAAYYGWFILLTVYLTSTVGYTDIEAGYLMGLFAALLYLFPFLSGAFADRVGYRPALLLALCSLTLGYLGLGLFPQKHVVLIPMAFVMLGGSLVKPIIMGTAAKSSTPETRARAFSLFYMMVNIGSFFGKGAAEPVRRSLGLGAVPFLSASITIIGFLCVALLYKPHEQKTNDSGSHALPSPGVQQALTKLLHDFKKVLSSGRLVAIVLISSGFWIIQSQMYSSMPKYVFRVVGEHASPEWYANVNPITVMLAVVPITWLCKKLQPVTSIAVGLGLIPLSALTIALFPGLIGNHFSVHPVTVAILLGISLIGLAECFLSPRYMEYVSRQAPKGQEALYMGYSNLNSFVAWVVGSISSGYLLDAFVPNPKKLSVAEQTAHALALKGQGVLPSAYSHANYLWFTFFGIGTLAFLALLVFARFSRSEDTPQNG